MTNEKETLTLDDWKSAFEVQDACNLSGVVFTFARIMQKICNDPENVGTDWKNNHPIAVLYASKISSLAGLGYSANDRAFEKACDAITARINKG